jgi:hypothetical protein
MQTAGRELLAGPQEMKFLCYDPDCRLMAGWENKGWTHEWRYGDRHFKMTNLGGTYRTLDRIDGRCDLGDGIVSPCNPAVLCEEHRLGVVDDRQTILRGSAISGVTTHLRQDSISKVAATVDTVQRSVGLHARLPTHGRMGEQGMDPRVEIR